GVEECPSELSVGSSVVEWRTVSRDSSSGSGGGGEQTNLLFGRLCCLSISRRANSAARHIYLLVIGQVVVVVPQQSRPLKGESQPGAPSSQQCSTNGADQWNTDSHSAR